jgi:hypothetical protein
MDSLIPALGPEGLAVVLTVVLILGTKEGGKEGKVKPLGWWSTLILSLIAGASYVAGGWPFDIVPKLIMGDIVGAIAAIKPGLSLPAIGISLMAVLMWLGLTRRQVAVIGLVLFYILAGAGGGLGTLSEQIKALADHFAS